MGKNLKKRAEKKVWVFKCPLVVRAAGFGVQPTDRLAMVKVKSRIPAGGSAYPLEDTPQGTCP